MTSDPYLRRWYLKFNDRLFGGSLPLDTEIWWQPCGNNVGLTFEITPAAEGEHATLGIIIDPCLMGLKRFARQTLVHEMGHVKLWPMGYKLKDHGAKFHEELQRLATFKEYRKLL